MITTRCMVIVQSSLGQGCERLQMKNKEKQCEIGENGKNRLKIKEKAEILAKEDFQK